MDESVASPPPLSGDQLERSNKKIKGPHGCASVNEASVEEEHNQVHSSPIRKRSPYRDALRGSYSDDNDIMTEVSGQYEEGEFVAVSDSEDDEEEDEKCPRVRFSASEKTSFWRPWKHSLICEVLGRSRVQFFGFKTVQILAKERYRGAY